MKILNLKDLEIGKEYYAKSNQFKAINKVMFLSRDRTGLDREIGYFIFTERGFKIEFESKHVFAIWQHELDDNNLEIFDKSPTPVRELNTA